MAEKLECFGCTKTPLLVTTFLSADGKRWAVYECVNPDCFFSQFQSMIYWTTLTFDMFGERTPNPKEMVSRCV